jgi:squalene-hopene/tetraprenyl-beta-curcumene cyclase
MRWSLSCLFVCALVSVTGALTPLPNEPGEPLPKLAPASPDEPFAKTLSVDRGAAFLEWAATDWTSRRNCGSCHTSYAYVMARNALPNPRADGVGKMRRFFADRVMHWDDKDGLPDDRTEATTEIVATAATLAFDDAQMYGKLQPMTRKALSRMWAEQREDGSWDWNKHLLPPQEFDDYYGAVFAAIGIGHAPDNYVKSEQAVRGLHRLRGYFRKNPPPNLHHQTLLLWASLKLDGLMTNEQRQQTVKDILAKQREDGGWSLPSLGNWKRLDNSDNDRDAPSDGYATGLVVYVLRQAGKAATDDALRRAVTWLKTHQRESGRWFTRSLNADRAHYTSNVGTAYALMALKACEE